MRVICIDDQWKAIVGKIVTSPVFGEVVTITNSMVDKDGDECVKLIEHPIGWFERAAFVPLSNIDEKELLEERELQLQNA